MIGKISLGVAGLTVAYGLVSAALDDGLKGCDVDGDGIVYTVSDDNVVTPTVRGAYEYDESSCFTNRGEVVLDRINAVNHAGQPLEGYTLGETPTRLLRSGGYDNYTKG